jgi:hypothetical protein
MVDFLGGSLVSFPLPPLHKSATLTLRRPKGAP